jgi:Tfp pilus assembly protein PilO
MMRYIMPIILLAISVAAFLTFANPTYQSISAVKAKAASYDEALNNSKALEIERDKLTAKYNSISAENLDKLEKLLPENVDNIRLILEIEKLASPYGMTLKDVRYDTTTEKTSDTASSPAAPAPSAGPDSKKNFGTWNLEFSTTGTYDNFISFVKDLENNLRVVDISSVEFSSNEGGLSGVAQNTAQSYKYTFKIKTYWLKN